MKPLSETEEIMLHLFVGGVAVTAAISAEWSPILVTLAFFVLGIDVLRLVKNVKN